MRSPKGLTPLLIAAQQGNIDICGLLLAHGSDVNEVELETKDTSLHEAAFLILISWIKYTKLIINLAICYTMINL